jgi:hypothetical protein
MFQLHPHQVKIRNKQEGYHKNFAIRCHKNGLSSFGGIDMWIYEKNRFLSHCNLGGTFEQPQGYTKAYMGGSD